MHLNDILRASFVKRWIIVPTIIQQSLADHTFNVVMIARALAKKIGMDDVNIIKAAIVHDLDEIHTGDIPASLKGKAHENGVDLNHLYYQVTKRELNPLEEQIVHMADLIEGMWFINNFGAGAFGHQVCSAYNKKVYDAIDKYRIEHPLFAGACEEIMDEIMAKEYVI